MSGYRDDAFVSEERFERRLITPARCIAHQSSMSENMSEEQTSSAFRIAEKTYQLHKELKTRHRHGKQRACGFVVRPVDLSALVSVHGSEADSSAARDALQPMHVPGWPGNAYLVRQCLGCIYFPAAVPPDVQLQIARDAFSSWPDAPATTNHHAAHGPISGLWHAAQLDQVFVGTVHPTNPTASQTLNTQQAQPVSPHKPQHSPQQPPQQPPTLPQQMPQQQLQASQWVDQGAEHQGKRGKVLPSVSTARRLLSKLRWASLGPRYDWTRRVYDRVSPTRPLPEPLRHLSLRLAAHAAKSVPYADADAARSSSACAHDAVATAAPVAHSVRCADSGSAGSSACAQDAVAAAAPIAQSVRCANSGSAGSSACAQDARNTAAPIAQSVPCADSGSAGSSACAQDAVTTAAPITQLVRCANSGTAGSSSYALDAVTAAAPIAQSVPCAYSGSAGSIACAQDAVATAAPVAQSVPYACADTDTVTTAAHVQAAAVKTGVADAAGTATAGVQVLLQGPGEPASDAQGRLEPEDRGRGLVREADGVQRARASSELPARTSRERAAQGAGRGAGVAAQCDHGDVSDPDALTGACLHRDPSASTSHHQEAESAKRRDSSTSTSHHQEADSAEGCSLRDRERGGVPAYDPDAVIVNYYHAGDTLNGHKDDVELDLRQPIVSVSVGADAVFLLGGETRDTPPVALLLRSGDVLVMSASARLCYHGVPRIFTDRELPAELECTATAEDGPFLEMLRTSRINLSIRHTRATDPAEQQDA